MIRGSYYNISKYGGTEFRTDQPDATVIKRVLRRGGSHIEKCHGTIARFNRWTGKPHLDNRERERRMYTPMQRRRMREGAKPLDNGFDVVDL